MIKITRAKAQRVSNAMAELKASGLITPDTSSAKICLALSRAFHGKRPHESLLQGELLTEGQILECMSTAKESVAENRMIRFHHRN